MANLLTTIKTLTTTVMWASMSCPIIGSYGCELYGIDLSRLTS